MSIEENVAVFLDTKKIVKSNKKLLTSVQKSNIEQKIISENDKLEIANLKKYSENAKVVISKKRTYEAASFYKGMKTVVHNFASALNPGGGVIRGANAQEESLCRCSTLYFNLNTEKMLKEFYVPHRKLGNFINNDDIIFTPSVTVFKSDTIKPELLNENNWYYVDVITCAAPNLRDNFYDMNNHIYGDNNSIDDMRLLEIHEKRLRRILDVAVSENEEVVILGAFGCGAFMNEAKIVALAAKNVLKDSLKAFRNIEFAIFCNPKDDYNYRIFESILNPITET